MAAIYVEEDDIAMYTIKTIDDPRTLNKTVYLRPPKNILSQREVVEIWEKLIGKELQKSSIPKEEFLASLKGTIDTGLISETSTVLMSFLAPNFMLF